MGVCPYDSLTGMFRVQCSLILLYFYYKLGRKERMSSIKIPELDLYRGRRRNWENQYARIEREGAKALRRTNYGVDLDEIRGRQYVQRYKQNLNHFVSPTRYKDKAQNYIKTQRKEQPLINKALPFPPSRYHCPNCNHKYKQQQNRCYCEDEQRLSQLNRVRSAERFVFEKKIRIQPPKRQIRHFQEINIQSKKTVFNTPFDELRENDEELSRGRGNSNKQLISEQRNSYELTINNFSFADPHSHSHISQHSQIENKIQINSIENEDRLQNHHIFITNLNKHEQRLNSLKLETSSPQQSSINMDSLIEAKKQYVKKSNQILNSLDRILHKYG